MPSAALLVIWLVHISAGLCTSPLNQRDLRTYYESAKLFHEGGDPYQYDALVRSSGDTLIWRYVYPPVTLPFFETLLVFRMDQIRVLYFLVQIAGILLLLYFWSRYFTRKTLALALLAIFFVVGFSGAASVDLRVGNVVILTQCVLWSAFAAFISRKYTVFAALIVLAALFKGVDILFLSLLLLESNARARKTLYAALGAFVVIHVAFWLYSPQIYREWAFNVYHLSDRGAENPAMLPAIEDLLGAFCLWLGIGRWWHTGHLIYLCYAAMFAFFAARFAARRGLISDRVTLVMFSVMTYALLLPRFKNYSYVLLLLPAAWLILTRVRSLWLSALLVLGVSVTLFEYQPLVVSIAMYVALVWSIHQNGEAHEPVALRDYTPVAT